MRVGIIMGTIILSIIVRFFALLLAGAAFLLILVTGRIKTGKW